ncbi:MAG TPA: cytidylate kinase-like family protein [Aggregatilineaceae bacterium]|nr:cytidylate kinase-like family protein [Aggregatilineaceae bacterium]
MPDEPFVITISHQLGSGGAYLGNVLSKRLGMPFIDREILKQVADQLNLSEAALENREERMSSFWETFARMAMFSNPQVSLVASPYLPSDQDLFQLESEYIKRIAEKASAIILGRCGRYILRDHPHHFSVMVHAELPARIKRVSGLFHVSQADAERLIEVNDKERASYIHTFTRQDWLNVRLYDLCVNTSRVGLDNTVELVCACVAPKAHG